MADELHQVFIRADDASKRIAIETGEGVYLFQPDEALQMVRAIMKCIIAQGYRPTIITDGEGKYVDFEII